MYILSQKGLLGLLMLLLEEFLSFYLPCVYPSFWLPWAKVYPVLWYMMFQENTENCCGSLQLADPQNGERQWSEKVCLF